MYRPKGWENQYQRNINDWGTIIDPRHDAFEAGADAMLEALIDRAQYINKQVYRTSGWTVFIPEVEE